MVVCVCEPDWANFRPMWVPSMNGLSMWEADELLDALLAEDDEETDAELVNVLVDVQLFSGADDDDDDDVTDDKRPTLLLAVWSLATAPALLANCEWTGTELKLKLVTPLKFWWWWWWCGWWTTGWWWWCPTKKLWFRLWKPWSITEALKAAVMLALGHPTLE